MRTFCVRKSFRMIRIEEAPVPNARTLDPATSFAACLGALLRRLRVLCGLTQAGLGRLTGYDGSYVGATERAAVRPSRGLIERCDHALKAGGALLALWPLADREWADAKTAGSPRTSRTTGDAPPPPPPAATRPVPPPPAPAATRPVPPPSPATRAVPPPGPGGPDPGSAAVVDAMELARRAEVCELGADALAGVERAVGRLRRAASATPPRELIPAVRAQLGYAGRLLEGRLTLGRHRRLLVAAGRLSLLLARLHFDAGDREAAEAHRDAALRLARQAGHAELAAWAVEAQAAWALADGRFRDALDLARTGGDLAPPASAAAVQLALDEAQAWTWLGDRDQAAGARRLAALTRAMLPRTAAS
jgi:tetratricopeptide (TPR) repeat protein